MGVTFSTTDDNYDTNYIKLQTLSEIGVVIVHQQIAEKPNEIPALQAVIAELGDKFIFYPQEEPRHLML
jgi:hypothetical protein